MKLGGKLLAAGGVALFLALMFAALVPLAVTDIYSMTDPVVCPEDDLQAVPRKEHFSDRHGTGFTLHVECVDEDGKVLKSNMEGLAFVTIAGAAFVPIFVLMFFWMLIPRKSSPVELSDLQTSPQEERAPSGGKPGLTGKLEELAEARDAGLITEEEYDQKKQELLDKF
jgi:hypothetical protein